MPTPILTSGLIPLLALAGTPAQPPADGAQPPAGGPPPFARPPRQTIDATLFGRGVQDTRLRNSRTSVEVARVGLDANWTYFARQNLILNAGLTYENSRFTFSNLGAQNVPAGNLLRDGRLLSFSPGFIQILDDRRTWGANLIVRGSGDPDADFSDSIETGVTVFGSYRKSDRLTYNYGFAAFRQVGGENLIFPILGVNWQISDRAQISTQPRPVGIGLRFDYNTDPRGTAFFLFSFENRNYRLDERSSVRGGVLRDQGFPLEVGYRFRPNTSSEISASVGYLIGQNYTLEDNRGREIFNRQQRAAPFLSLSAKVVF